MLRLALRSALPVLVLAPLAACAPRAYVPVVAVTPAGDTSLAAHAERLDVGRSFWVTVVVDRAPAGAHLADVYVAPESSPPCSRSWSLAALEVDGITSGAYTAPIHDGSHLRADLEGIQELWQRPMRVDLVVDDAGERRCLPVSFTSDQPERAWRQVNEGFWSFHLDAAAYTERTSGSVATIAFGLRFGKWFGPTQVYGGIGVGTDACSGAVCAPAKDGGPTGGLALPVDVGVQTMGLHLGQTSFFGDTHLGIGVRYQVTPTFLPTYGGDQWHGYDGLYVVPAFRFGLREPLAPGVPGGFHSAGSEIQIPIGVIAPMPEHNHLALSIGVSLAFGATSL